MNSPVVVWFRLDLRLAHNPALAAAVNAGTPIIPVFIWAPEEEGNWPPGAASRWWLHHSLRSLDSDLRRRGMRLVIRKGSSLGALRSIIRETNASSVFWNRRYEPALVARDNNVRDKLLADGLRVATFNSALLFEPEEIKNSNGRPFRVFTPFWKFCLSAVPDFAPESASLFQSTKSPPSSTLDELGLEPSRDWADGLRASWQPGERGAQKALRRFLKSPLNRYEIHRDFPAAYGTSRLSPHLHFGEISPQRVWMECARHPGAAARAFLRQLGWREFAHHLLHHFPHTAEKPLSPQFDLIRWRHDSEELRAWQRGRTGYSIVDAGMRELWATGWMHNRVRMIVGSFLVKDLLLPWIEGARWFWDTLVDADLANNTLGWQWVAGCGADAAPFFRIFNPVLQAKKFDPDGKYVRMWVKEFNTADYGLPIVNHAQARRRALEALSRARNIKIWKLQQH
jgi:deoxyribodipyrimidine photo-lyase